jgi:hypothetical protein
MELKMSQYGLHFYFLVFFPFFEKCVSNIFSEKKPLKNCHKIVNYDEIVKLAIKIFLSP